jgi:predicted helicase
LFHRYLPITQNTDQDIPGWVDAIPAETLNQFREVYGAQVSSDDVFFAAYAMLHAPNQQHQTVQALAQTPSVIWPLIPKNRFDHFINAGRDLFDLHVDWQQVEPWPGLAHITQLQLPETASRIPPEAWEWHLGETPAIEWFQNLAQTANIKPTQLIARIVTVSIRTTQITQSLKQ